MNEGGGALAGRFPQKRVEEEKFKVREAPFKVVCAMTCTGVCTCYPIKRKSRKLWMATAVTAACSAMRGFDCLSGNVCCYVNVSANSVSLCVRRPGGRKMW